MKQSLQLKLGQQLTMTPQLQQAIKLLQLSTMDLQQEIQQALESNPMLEITEDSDQPEVSNDAAEQQLKTSEQPVDPPVTETPGENTDWSTTIPDELPVDTQWEDMLPSSAPSTRTTDAADMDFASQNSAGESLHDKLDWQLNLTRLSDIDRIIAMTIIDATDETGRLTLELEELHDSLNRDMDVDIELDEIVAVLHCLQQFDPAGVCTSIFPGIVFSG